MLKLREEQITLWDAIIPEAVWTLPDELAKVIAEIACETALSLPPI